MNKYIVYTPARTGSTLYCRVLDLYYKHLYGTTDNVFWEDDLNKTTKYNTKFSIYHTHEIDFLTNAPTNFIKVVATRSIIDSVLSRMVAHKTGYWHFDNSHDQKRYLKKFQNKKFYFDPNSFIHWVNDYNQRYSQIDQYINSNPNNLIVLSYTDHALNLKNLGQTLGFDRKFISILRQNHYISSGGTQILNKYQLIENLPELVQIYVKLNVQSNYNDAHAFKQISKILKQ